MSSKENVLIKQRSERGSDQFTQVHEPVVLCALSGVRVLLKGLVELCV